MARGLLGQSGLVLAAKVMAAGAAYVLAWALGRVAGVEAFGRFELVLTLTLALGPASLRVPDLVLAPTDVSAGEDRRASGAGRGRDKLGSLFGRQVLDLAELAGKEEEEEEDV